MSYQTGDPLGMRLRIAPGANLNSDPSTYTWQEITYDLVMDVDQVLDDGSADEATDTNSQFTCSLRDNRGRYDPDNPESDLWPNFDLQCPLEWAINPGDGSGWNVLFSGYIANITEDYSSRTPHKVRRAITAAGPFRRLNQSKAIFSALTRYTRTVKPVMYWRLEDLANSRQAQSDVAGRPPMVLLPSSSAALPTFAARTGMPGSLPVAQFTVGSRLDVVTTPYVPIGSSIRWSFIANLATLTTTTTILRATMAGSTAAAWEVFVTPTGAPQLRALNLASGTIFTSTFFAPPSGFIGNANNSPSIHPWLLYCVTLQQSGADINWTFNYSPLWISDVGNLDGFITTITGTLTGTLVGQPTGYVISPAAAAEDMAVGHLSLTDSATGLFNSGSASVMAWPGNASNRITGVANEFGVPNNVTGSTTSLVGPEPLGTVVDMIRDGAKVDHGIVSDGRGVITYRGLADLYNVTPAITLDGSNRELFLPYAPVRDDQKHRNRVTVTRQGGSNYLADNLVDQARTGLAEGTETINVASDLQLPDHAGYFLAVGTVAGKRYPQVTLDFLRAPQLVKPWLAMRLGDRFLLTNPPRAGAKDDVQLQLRGYKQTWSGRYRWIATCNTIKADPFNVGVLDDPILGRAEADLNAVTVPVETTSETATTINVTVAPDTPRIMDSVTLPGDFPVYLNWEGERIRMTACTQSPLDTFTRGLSSSWGSPDVGPAYSTSGGAAADYGVSGTRGTMALTSTGVERTASLANMGPDLDVIVYLVPTVVATGAQFEQKLRLRWSSGSVFYETNVQYQTDGSIALYLIRNVTVLSGIVPSVTYTSASVLGLRMQTIGSTIRHRLWNATTSPLWPGTWDATATDTTFPGSPTDSLLLVGNRITSNTNAGLVVQWDNLSVPNTQTMTVDRSVNRVRKIHKAGSVISLWQPMMVAL